jgi:hypothetical protein
MQMRRTLFPWDRQLKSGRRPQIVHEVGEVMHRHMRLMLAGLGVVLLALAVVAVRKGFGKRAATA